MLGIKCAANRLQVQESFANARMLETIQLAKGFCRAKFWAKFAFWRRAVRAKFLAKFRAKFWGFFAGKFGEKNLSPKESWLCTAKLAKIEGKTSWRGSAGGPPPKNLITCICVCVYDLHPVGTSPSGMNSLLTLPYNVVIFAWMMHTSAAQSLRSIGDVHDITGEPREKFNSIGYAWTDTRCLALVHKYWWHR